MSERNLVLLAGDIFRHLYSKQANGQFNDQLQQQSQQLLDEIQNNPGLKAVVAQVTLDSVSGIIETWYGAAIAKGIIADLQRSGLEILPKPNVGESVALDDANNVRVAEIKSAIANQVTELITHFPSDYASGSPLLPVVGVWTLLDRLSRARLERTLQASNSLERSDLVSTVSANAHHTESLPSLSTVATIDGNDLVAAQPGTAVGIGGEALSLLLIAILVYILAILASLTAQTGKSRSDTALDKGIPGLGMLGLSNSLSSQSLSGGNHSNFDALSLWATLLLLATPFLSASHSAELGSQPLDRSIAENPNMLEKGLIVPIPQPLKFQSLTRAINNALLQPRSQWDALPINESLRLIELSAAFSPTLPQVGYGINFFDGLPVQIDWQNNVLRRNPSSVTTATSSTATSSIAEQSGNPSDQSSNLLDQSNKQSTQLNNQLTQPSNLLDQSTNPSTQPSKPSWMDKIYGALANETLAPPLGSTLLNRLEENRRTEIQANSGERRIEDFGGVGRGVSPSQETIKSVDSLILGSGLMVENMILTQWGRDLKLTFEDVENTTVILVNFALENLENLEQRNGASETIGNIFQADDRTIQDRFDVVNAEWNSNRVLNPNTVTFLSDRDNYVMGWEGDSNDIINGQGGNDILSGLDGDDTLRGGDGNDVLIGGIGKNTLVGGSGSDVFVMEKGGHGAVKDFTPGQDLLGLPSDLTYRDLKIEQSTEAMSRGNTSSTLIFLLGERAPLMELVGIQAATLTPSSFLTFRNQGLSPFQ